MTRAVELAQIASTGVSEAFKNRVINGGMTIDQRNSGSSISVTNNFGFPVDRFIGVTAASTTLSFQRSTVAPPGFTNSLLSTVTTPKTMAAADLNRIIHRIEGFNVADLGFGTANALTVTLSFWVRSSVTGTYAVHFGSGQNYLASYTINAANTWEFKSITVPGSTSGSWPTDNTTGLELNFILGAGSDWIGPAGSWGSSVRLAVAGAANFIGTNGATFYLTGVQLEVGSSATSFEYRPFGTELALCQRYYTQIEVPDNVGQNGGNIGGGYQVYTSMYFPFKQTMRSAPTIIQNLSITTNDAGTQTFTTSVDGYVVKHGNTSALYTYINGTAKFSSEI